MWSWLKRWFSGETGGQIVGVGFGDAPLPPRRRREAMFGVDDKGRRYAICDCSLHYTCPHHSKDPMIAALDAWQGAHGRKRPFMPSQHDRCCARLVELYDHVVVKPTDSTACIIPGGGTC